MTNREVDAIREMLSSRPRPTGLAERRERLDGLGAGFALPSDVRTESVQAGSVAAEWTETPGAEPGRVILFLHGGGYISGSIKSHRHMIAEAGRQARARTLALGYRLAPEHPFPAALEDSAAAYRFLLSSGFDPANIVLAGESAGGGLAVATLISLRDAGDPLPACAWCSSPWVDLTMSGSTMASKAAVDPLIQRGYLTELAAAYLHGADPRNPLVSPIYADLRVLPPMLIQVGSAETLLADAVALAARAGEADVRVTLQVWPEMIHAWHLFHPQLAAGREAIAEVGRFVRAGS
ncbi:MAG: alpha/beta hydrolase [Acetobacteraceae bacterium]|nr:alpha/beta hydrolase [Acetobacteraceae bacterium]